MYLGNVFIVGFGKAGRAHAAELAENDEGIRAKIYVVELRNKIDQLQSNFREVSFLSVEDFLAMDEISGTIVLCIPPVAMGEFLDRIAAKEWEYRLAIEKPGPWPFEAAASTIKCIEQQGKLVFICHQRQYSDHLLGISDSIQKRRLQAGGIGSVHLQKWDFRSAGTHWMAFSHACFGRPVSWRGAIYQRGLHAIDHRYPIESLGAIEVEHESGAIVHWELGAKGKRSDFRYFAGNGFAEVKVSRKPLARIVLADTVEKFETYGFARARLLTELCRGNQPRIGCTMEDLRLYLKIYEECVINGLSHLWDD